MTVQADSPHPVPELTPVPVHIKSAEPDALDAPARPHKATRTDFTTETVDNTNPVRPVLPASPRRRGAHIQVTGGDVYLCDSESKANQAAGNASSDLGAILPHGNTAPWPLGGQQAVWAAQVTASTTCVISVTADYTEE